MRSSRQNRMRCPRINHNSATSMGSIKATSLQPELLYSRCKVSNRLLLEDERPILASYSAEHVPLFQSVAGKS